MTKDPIDKIIAELDEVVIKDIPTTDIEGIPSQYYSALLLKAILLGTHIKELRKE